MLEQEINLRPYLQTIRTRWYWLIIGGIIGGVLGLVVAFTRTPTYQATTLIAVTDPLYTPQFDNRFPNSDRQIAHRAIFDALPRIATSDQVVAELLETSGAFADSDFPLTTLRNRLRATPVAQPTLVRLDVTTADPALSQALANLWAQLVTASANNTYGGQSGAQLTILEGQLADAMRDLNAAQDALVAFSAQDRSAILAARLQVLQTEFADVAQEKEQLDDLRRNVSLLLTQLNGQTISNASLGDQLTAIGLQLETFGVELPGQFSITGLVSVPLSTQITQLSGLATSLETQLQALDIRLADLEPQILALQSDLQAAEGEKATLDRTYELADENHLILSRKVAEANLIASEEVRGYVQFVSEAAEPEFPTGPRKLFVIGFFGILGGIVAFVLLLWRVWRREVGLAAEAAS